MLQKKLCLKENKYNIDIQYFMTLYGLYVQVELPEKLGANVGGGKKSVDFSFLGKILFMIIYRKYFNFNTTCVSILF